MNFKKLAVRAAITVAAFAIATAPAYAATDRAVIDSYYPIGNGVLGVSMHYMDGSTEVFPNDLSFSIGNSTTSGQLEASANAAIYADAVNQGFTLTNGITSVTPSISDIASMIAAATSSLPTPSAMSFGSTTRALNTAFQVSSSRAAFVSYSVDVSSTMSLTSGQTGTVTLEYADNSGFTSGVTTVQSAVNGNTGTLTLGLALTQIGTASVSGMVPAGKYVKLVTANTTGTPTFTFRASQEVLMPSN